MGLPNELSAAIPKRLRLSLPFAIAFGSLCFLLWYVIFLWQLPYHGIQFYSPVGVIQEIDPLGPAADVLRVGDRILSIQGTPFSQLSNIYAGLEADDPARFVVERASQQVEATVILSQPTPVEVTGRLLPLVVALAFWGVGAGVLAFSLAGPPAERFFLFSQAGCLLLVAGLASTQGPPWASTLFNCLLWWVGPLAVHFHLVFPQTARWKGQKILLAGLYSLALAGAFPYLIWGATTIRSSTLHPALLTSSRLFLAANLLLVVLQLVSSYRSDTAGARAKIRMVVLGGVLSALPVASLTILPDLLLGRPIIPYQYAFLLLALLPITYGFAIIRHRLVAIDRHVNRGATVILVYSILGGFYLLMYASLERWLHTSLRDSPLVNTVLVLILASIYGPLNRGVQKVVDRIFYGGWYDYRTAVTGITAGLEQITDLVPLSETVSERLVRTLRLVEGLVFLRDLDGSFSVIFKAPRSRYAAGPAPLFTALPRGSLTYLLKTGLIERNALKQALAEKTISPQERSLLDDERVVLWVPIIGHEQVLGLVALGPKYGGDVLSAEDLDILRVVAQHTSPMIENIHLVTHLRRHAESLEKRVAERTNELNQAKERVEAILTSVGEGVIVTDLDWKVVTFNPAFEQQSGCSGQEILGRPLWDFLSPNDLKTQPGDPPELFGANLKNGNPWTVELDIDHKNGQVNTVQMTLSPVWDQAHQIVGYVGSQRDITRQKEIDRLKDRLIFAISHELRTPVTNLQLYLELLERGRPEKQAEYLGILKRETDQLRNLFESILDLSRLDMWKTKKISLTVVDLNLVVEQVAVTHYLLAETAGLELVYEPGSRLPVVRGEPNQLARLVTNLLTNAISYTPSGKIWLRTFERDGRAWIQMEDTGLGIETEDLPNIFDRFYRGRLVNQSRINGAGLGLSIVKEIVEIHEGGITVESKPGVGSIFSVWLPAEVAREEFHHSSPLRQSEA